MPDNNKRKILYDHLIQDGYDLGDYDSFSKNLDNETKRKNLYDAITSDNYDVGDYDSFSKKLDENAMGGSVANQVIAEYDQSARSSQGKQPQDNTIKRPIIKERVENKFPEMEDLPWMRNSVQKDGMISSDDLGNRLETAFKKGDFESFRHREEEKELDSNFKAKPVVDERDIHDNYMGRFSNTERGIELNDELNDVQSEFEQKYFDEFKKTPEYKSILKDKYHTREEADKANKTLNELFNQKYGEAIRKDMAPYYEAYQDELFARYGYKINSDMLQLNKKNTSSQINDIEKDVKELLDEKHASLRRRGANNVAGALMSSYQYNSDNGTASQRKEIGALEASQRLLEKSQEIIAEAGKKGNTNFFGGFGRGLRDNFDWENFTFGLVEMADAKLLNDALKKAEKGETLTSGEEKLLEASVVNMATQAYFGSDLGRGYKSGQTTAISLPFMLEFIANPISGSGNAIAKRLLKYGMKRFAVKSMGKKGAKFATRLLGDAAAAAGMEGTTSLPRVASGAFERLNENYKYSFDDNGVMQVEKVGDTRLGGALVKSAASTFFENQSEMIFNAFKGFSPFMKAADNALPGGVSEFMKRIKNSKAGTLYRNLMNNPTLKEIVSRAQFHGLPEEYMEEVYNNLANVAIGEMSIEDVTDLDNNIDTFLGLAPTSVIFATIGLGGMSYEKLVSKRKMERIFGRFTDEQKRKFEELRHMSKETGNRDIREFIKETMADEGLSQEERRLEIEYAFELAKQNAIDELQDEQPETIQAAEAAYDEGTSIPPERHYYTEQEKTMSGEALRNADRNLFNVVNSILENEGGVKEFNKMLTGVSDEVAALARDYYNKAQRVEGIIDAGLEDAQNAGDEFERSIQDAIVTDENGNQTITTATYRDAQVYVLADDGKHATILRDEKKEMVGSDQLSDIQQSDADAVIKQAKNGYLQQKQEELNNSINHHPKTRMPQTGMQLWSGNTPYIITDVSLDGIVQAFPSERDAKTGQVVAKKDGMVNMDIEEAKKLQDEYYDKMDTGNEPAGAEEFSMMGYVPEKENIPDEQEVSGLRDEDATSLMEAMEKDAFEIPQIELNPANWEIQFGENGRVLTPVGEVKMGENQIAKLFEKGRSEQFGMIKPTLETPHAVIEVASEDAKGSPERNTSYLFIRAFIGKDGKKTYYFKSVTVRKDGLEVSISSHFDRPKRVKEALKKGKLLYRFDGGAQTEHRPADVSVTTSPELEQGVSESKDSKHSAEKQEVSVNNLIPVDEKGVPIYHKAPLEATVADLTDGTLTYEEVDGFVEANQKEAQSELKKITDKAPKIGTNKAKYIADKKAWQAKVDEAQAKVDYWGQVQDVIKESRVQPGDKVAEEIYAMGGPLDGHELAAQMLANGQLPLLREDYMRETGFGSKEASGMFGLFRSKENGGMSIEEAGERLMLADLEAETGLFDQNDANAGRNALLDVLSSVKTRRGLTDYIKNNREDIAERERTAEQAYEDEQREAWAQEHFGMSYADYVLYEEVIGEIIKEKAVAKEFIQDFYDNFAEELNNRYNGRTEEDVTSYERRADSSGSESGKGLLPSEQLDDNRGIEKDTSAEADDRTDNKSIPAQEEAGTEGVDILSGSIEAANESRMDDISARLSEIDSRLIELEDVENGADDFAFAGIVLERNELAQEKDDLEAEYAGLAEMQRESEVLMLEEEQAKQVLDNIAEERKKVDVNPTDAQKEAGNYKKGHVSVDGYDITLENPKDSERSGTDVNGNKWSVTMNNDYGYIRSTEGVDGDHIDVFLSDFPGQGSVYVVDQINPDTGEFDEHKVMYGFSSMEDATAAYFANYSPGWKGLGTVSEVSKEEFKKWIESSHRKTKPFAEYKSVKMETAQGDEYKPSNSKNEVTIQKSGNRLVTEERYAELRERMRKKLGGQMNMGIDPEILAIGTEMAVYHIENGARKFAEYAKAMIVDLGDTIRPYLKSFYNGARDLPEVAENDMYSDMTPYVEVQDFDVANFDKTGVDLIATAETVAKEKEVKKEFNEAKEQLKKRREEKRKNERKSVTSPLSEKKGNRKSVKEGGLFGDLFDEPKKNDYERVSEESVAAARAQREGDSQDGAGRTDKQGVLPTQGRNVGGTVYVEPGRVDGNLQGGRNDRQGDRGIPEREGEAEALRSGRRLRDDSVRVEDILGDKSIEGKRKKEREKNLAISNELKGVELRLPDKYGVEHTITGIVYYELANVFHFNDNIDGPKEISRKGLEDILRAAKKHKGVHIEKKNIRNNHSERGRDYAPTSVDARIDANIKAIELARKLLDNGEQATSEQMEVLRKFSGWGGLGAAFNLNSSDVKTRKRAEQIQQLLGTESYGQAVMNANSAYYTPAYVVDTLWDIAGQMGFKGGNILEGSAGIGNILGQMPASISERSDIHAVEIDGTSGGILSLLYPDSNVEIQGFENTRVPNGSVDLAITNVPFVTGLRVNDTTGDKDLSRKFHNIHDFCIAKNVRKLREGGLGIFITSNGTLDNSKKLREWVVNEGGSDFIGAFRMNNKTFGGTGVTSDIIVIRKRVNGKKSANAIDVSEISGERVAEYDTGETRKVNGKETAVVKPLSMDYNRYFIEHPEMMAGKMMFAFEEGDTFRPTSKGLYPENGKDQKKMLSDFVRSFKEEKDLKNAGDSGVMSEPAFTVDSGKKIGEVFVKDGNLYINLSGVVQPLSVNDNKVKGHTKAECFESYSKIKKVLSDVLEYQTNNEDNKGLKPLLDKLNKAYDDFVKTYGHFNKNTAISFLRNDVDYANVASVETYKETGDGKGGVKKSFGKADVMKSRVLERDKEPTPSNVKDGIVASMFKYGRIDVPYIADQLGKTEEDVKKEILDNGYGYEDPTNKQMEVSFQYLSGNVREKLRQAEENNVDGSYDRNVKDLQEVIPMDIPAHLIDFTLGSSWVESELYNDYVKDRTDVDVKFTPVGGAWFMETPSYGLNKEKNRAMGVRSELLQRTIMGHELIDAAINNKSITVSTTRKKWDGTTETITDKDATQACAAKIDEIRQDFKEWARQKMQSDSEMSKRMEKEYNDRFNNYIPMIVSEEFLPKYFAGASRKFEMRPHQKRAIVRGTMQPLMLAHEVGSGKTFTLISTAMEMRRLGIARKPMIVVQNATVGQFVASAKELYPNAKILTLEEVDRSAEGRKNFYAKIRYNDWDMIVVPQSTFEFIPDSEERQMSFIQDKIEEKMLVLEQMKETDPDGKNIITRQAEKEIANLEEELAGLSEETSKKRTASDEKKRAIALQNANVKAAEMLDRRTDDVENFDDMGIDALLVDEAHEYKHLGFPTSMQRGVKGVDPSYSKKSQGVYLKTQAILEKNNGRNVIFATGTPISNTAAEIWTFMRYLMPADTMKEYGIYYFDDFVRNFGNIQQMLEFTPSGKFKENNRFAGYVNLPELVRIWSGVADTVRFEEIEEDRRKQGKPDLRPEMEGGKAQDIYLPQTKALRSIMKYVKKQFERFEKMSGKEKKENSHIPLTMYGIAKSAAVDARLVQANAEDDERSKTNEAVRQTLRSLKETADYKGTVAIFADNYQNKASGFNLYDDIRNKLIKEGVPADEVVVIRPGMTVKKKLEVFDKVNRGEVRVVLGSTYTLGTGVNIQERLHTLIHLDAPNRPMDYTQRNGRILRQGNLHKAMNKPVRILRFGVEDSLDVTAYQRLKTKGAIADSIMNGSDMMANSMSNRVLEEEEDVFGDTVAQLSGSEYAMLKNNAEKNVRKYESRKKQWEVDQTYIHHAKPRLEGQIASVERAAKENQKYLQIVEKAFPDGKFGEIKAGKQSFGSIDDMGEFFKEQNKKVLDKMKQMKDGGEDSVTRELTISIGGMDFKVRTELNKEMNSGGGQLFAEVHRKMNYSCPELGLEDVPVRQGLLRNAMEDIIDNVLTGKDYKERIETSERTSSNLRSELTQLKLREGKPFEFEDELKKSREQLDEYSELMKNELEEKEAKYAEMDKSVEEAENISLEEEDDLLREGAGAYTDRELSETNDPMAKMLGKSVRTKKQQREFAERERRRMAAHAEELAKKLHLDDVEIVTDASTLEGKQKRSKGFYSKRTGKITIVIPNHADMVDVEQTLLHEAVGHYGLRELFGEQFDTFLDNVFVNADAEVRGRIVELAERNGWDFRTATEEYLAGLAERTDFENTNASWWQKIKGYFLDMLHRIGFDGFNGVTLTDNELRYILWRSYENLAEPGRFRSIFGEAADAVKQRKLKVGDYAETTKGNGVIAADSGETLYRDGDPEVHERALARDRYEQRMSSGMYQTQEALQDSMLSLREAMQSILGKRTRIEDVVGFENAYLGENRLSSVNKAEADAFAQTLFKPMLDEVARLAPTEETRMELTDYMMAKHGLERNRVMAEREAKKEHEEYVKQHPKGPKTLQDFMDENHKRDYAGLTALTGMDEVADAELAAQDMVNDYESRNDTDNLWNKVNAVNRATLSKSYESGMMSKDTFDDISGMYEFYIPLRGFDEKTSAEAYAYLTNKNSAFNAPIRKSEGRKSKADDPFANMQSMAESAIVQGNRNMLVKQRFLNFVLNHPSDLFSISDLWVEYDDVTDEWKPVFPDNIKQMDTAEEVEQKMNDFEKKMKRLAENETDKYKRGKDAKNIPYRIVESRDLNQHQVIVKRGGRDYVITVNGNPRVAQALNGQTNPDNDLSGAIGTILRIGENINRQLSAFYTTRNPDFIVSNFIRDMLYTNSMAWVKESPNYALRFQKNYLKFNPVNIKKLLSKYKNGTIDRNIPVENMFYQFMMNGGETGYANMRDIEQHKNDIRRELKKANEKIPVKRAWDLLGERFDEYNRAVENCARFAAFVTSREMGRSIDRSVYDAKEISVNFNKKGSGAKFLESVGQTNAGNMAALVSGLGRIGYVFWNAAIQGTTNFGRQIKRYPAKAFTGAAAMFLLGAVTAYLGGDDDDDKNAYYNLSEYVRRSNILFSAGEHWISLPLPIEYRAFYGMGELMVSILSGNEHFTGGEIASAIAGQVTQVLPIDFLEGGGGLNAFIPSATKPLWEAYVVEKSWTGMPLYKNTPYNKDMPEWTKAYKSANKYIVWLAEVMNEASGGDTYTKGTVDINPAKIEYLLNGYFGGVSGTIDKLSKTAETIAGTREYDPRSVLLMNRLVKAGDERTEYRAVNNEYLRLKEEYGRTKKRLRNYEKDTERGIFDYSEKIDFLYNSPEYARYEIFESYRKEIDVLDDELNEAVDDKKRKEIESALNELKKEMIEEMNKTRKKK